MAQLDTFRRWQSDVSAALARLSPRERNLVMVCSLALIVGIIFFTGHAISNAINHRIARIASKTTQLEQVAQLTAGFAQAERERNDLERKLSTSNVRLIALVGELGKKLGVDIGGMSDKGAAPAGDGKISESSVEIQLLHIDLDRLTRFLHAIEQSQGIVKVKRIQVRPRSDEQVLDAYLTVATYQVSS
jgi:type II secretory pathway component PulM